MHLAHEAFKFEPDVVATAWSELQLVELRRLRVLLDAADTWAAAAGQLIDTGLQPIDYSQGLPDDPGAPGHWSAGHAGRRLQDPHRPPRMAAGHGCVGPGETAAA